MYLLSIFASVFLNFVKNKHTLSAKVAHRLTESDFHFANILPDVVNIYTIEERFC